MSRGYDEASRRYRYVRGCPSTNQVWTPPPSKDLIEGLPCHVLWAEALFVGRTKTAMCLTLPNNERTRVRISSPGNPE